MSTQNNGPSLTGIVDITANSIRLFQNNGSPKNIEDISISKNDISIAEPYDVPIDEICNVIQMYKFLGEINGTKVAGLEPLLNCMNENFFSKDEPAVNEHCYNITKQQYNEDIHHIYNIDKSKSYNINNQRYTGDHYYNSYYNKKKQS